MNLNNQEDFANEFLNEYMRISFGSLSKKEIELLIFKLILKDQDLYKNFDKYKVSALLKISENKVVSLYKELQLRDEEFNEEWFKQELKQLLDKSKIELSSKKVILQINNPFLKLKIEEYFNKKGVIIDYSFNKNILKIHVEAFVFLMDKILDDDTLNKIKTSLEIKKDYEVNNLMKIALENFVKGASNQAGKKLVDLGIGIFTNGIDSLISFINQYKEG